MTKAHGKIAIEEFNGVIIVRAKGSFNEFGIKDYTEQAKKIIKKKNGDKFSILINALNAEGGTPEAFHELEKFNAWLKSVNLVAKATVISCKTTLGLLDKFSPSRKNQNIRNFENEEEALQWLQSLM